MKIQKRFFWFLSVWLFGALVFTSDDCRSMNDTARRIESPNGILSVEVNLDREGMLTFDLFYNSVPVMRRNRLGLIRENSDFSKNLSLVSVSAPEKIEDTYTLLHGKKGRYSYRGNRKVFHCKNKEGKTIDII